MDPREKKNTMPWMRPMGLLLLLITTCLSMTIMWSGGLEAQMGPRQILQRDETRLESKPPPAQAAPAPAPPVIVVEPPKKAVAAPPFPRVSDKQIEELTQAIKDLTKEVQELKAQIRKNKGEPQAPPKNQ